VKYRISSLIVDAVLRIWQRIPALVLINLEKARILKKLFWNLNVDGLEGDYFEFGVAHGHSMRSAAIAEATSYSKQIGVKRINRSLWGFDTFTEFKSNNSIDIHPIWNGENFNVGLSKVQRRFRSVKNVNLIQVNANDLKSHVYDQQSDYGFFGKFSYPSKAGVILFDMDLYAPTKSALTWVKQFMQPGTFLVFDEYFGFSGNANKGEAKAFSEFLEENPQIYVRDLCSYGAGGKVFVISSMNRNGFVGD